MFDFDNKLNIKKLGGTLNIRKKQDGYFFLDN